MDCVIITTTTTAATVTMIPWRTWKCHCIRYQPTARSLCISNSSSNNSYQNTASSPPNRGIRWPEGVWDIPSLASTTIILRRRAQPAVICTNYRIRRSTQITEVPWQTWTIVPGIMTSQLMCWTTHTAERQTGFWQSRPPNKPTVLTQPLHKVTDLCAAGFPLSLKGRGMAQGHNCTFFSLLKLINWFQTVFLL